MFKKILVANRGEITVRVIRTIKEMGITTVAVYSDADATALHAIVADEAYPLGDSQPKESYLNMAKIIGIAKECGAEAIHPGYGFLSENADFSRAVTEAGLVFIGPKPEVITALGNKTNARALMSSSGVPVVPGMIASDADPKALAEWAAKIGYPVLIKAAAGGGGKGMRICHDAKTLPELAKSAASEALSAFGDGSIYLEKYIANPRHVEIQVMADNHGNAVALFERECSIQRRHQKIIEESPCAILDEKTRTAMCEAAVTAVTAAGYSNAGTVEFLLDEQKNFYFLEVNTRLQVEHPVTEMITGLDLVRHQILIAAGEKLTLTKKNLTRRGHAIECRIYAEDPGQNFMPSPGKIEFLSSPNMPGVRLDSGIHGGFTVPVFYDPILAKLIVWAENRDAAINRMIAALKETVVLGVATAAEFMIDILDSADFRAGRTDTHFIDEKFKGWKPKTANDPLMIAAALAFEELRPKRTAVAAGGSTEAAEVTPWMTLGKWDIAG